MSQTRRHKVDFSLLLPLLLPLLLALSACGPALEIEPGRTGRDGVAGGLFDHLLDGKFDAAGHPTGARVFQAETDCEHETGARRLFGWGAEAEEHAAGALCRLQVPDVSEGPYTLNVRLLSDGRSAADCGASCPPQVLVLRVLDQQGQLLRRRTLYSFQVREPMVYQNLWVNLELNRQQQKHQLQVVLDWPGHHGVRVDYLELFRSARRVVISPPSGLVTNDDHTLSLELLGQPLPASASLWCNGGEAISLEQLRQQQQVSTTQSTEFRTLVRLPSAPLLQGCERPARLTVRGEFGATHVATARTTYRDQPVPCSFVPGTRKVLLTGFEPFPADATSDNSSEHAVRHFDAAPLGPGVSVMRVILPVEWDTAAAMVRDLIQRCQPDLVLSMGQGRNAVELEQVAYNLKSATDVSGGVADNRGIVFDGQPIVDGGPADYSGTLPAEAIREALRAADVWASLSTDPGRYICNNVYYSVMDTIADSGILGGFIHLPRMAHVDADEQQMLQTVVQTAVQTSLASIAP